MSQLMSACGVICSGCPAFHAAEKGVSHQQRTADAWRRIYGLGEEAANIRCGGCLGRDADLFHTSVRCAARACCLRHAYRSCAECPRDSCADLERAQSQWDGVPEIGATLSEDDRAAYARPYCGHRARLAAARAARPAPPQDAG